MPFASEGEVILLYEFEGLDIDHKGKPVLDFIGQFLQESFGNEYGLAPRMYKDIALDTPMNKVMMEQFKKVYGRDMKIMATHGGLECAIMGAKYPNWEMVSVGPTIKYPHSPDERVNIASVERTWHYLTAVLENIPEK